MTTPTDEALTRLLEQTAASYDVPAHGPAEVLAALADRPVRVPLIRRRWVQLTAAAAVLTLLAGVAVSSRDGGQAQISAGRADSDQINRLNAPLTYGRVPADVGSAAEQKSAPVRDFTSMGSASTANSLTAVPGSGAGSSGGTAAVAPAPVPVGGSGAAPGLAPGASIGAVDTDGGETRVVKSGSLALVVKDKRVSPTLTAVEKAARAQGGYIASGTADEAGDNPSGELIIRVPVSRFEALIAAVRGLDVKVLTASTSGRDVTAQYADQEAQLRTLKAARERFLLLLSKARTIGEILTVQQRVDEVTGRIDRLEGQRRLLANQSDLSTLTVSVSEAGDPVVRTTQPRSGLSQALQDAKDGFVSGVEGLIRHSGRALLLALCLAVAFVVGRVLWRVARRRLV